jgi:hypothetical protein
MATLLKTVVVALVLLAGLTALKFEFEHHLAPSTSGLEGELHHARLNIVLLGSSHTRQGYDVAALEHLTGRTAFAVAYDGLDMASMLPLVEAILADPAKRPDLLVLEANSANFARGPELEEPRLFFDAPPSVKRALMRQYLRTHRDRQAYLDMWTLAANRGSELILAYPFVARAIDHLSYNGGYLGKNASGLPPAGFADQHIPVVRSDPNPDQLEAFLSILNLVKAAHVRLLLAEPPMPASVEAQPEIQSLQRQFRGLAAAQDIPFYEGGDGFPDNDPALFHDSNHLSTAGRELYTQRFSAELNEGGWLTTSLP